jgi:hypothetical protein
VCARKCRLCVRVFILFVYTHTKHVRTQTRIHTNAPTHQHAETPHPPTDEHTHPGHPSTHPLLTNTNTQTCEFLCLRESLIVLERVFMHTYQNQCVCVKDKNEVVIVGAFCNHKKEASATGTFLVLEQFCGKHDKNSHALQLSTNIQD